MSRKAVTKAALRRAFEILEERGRVVTALTEHPDGSVTFGLTDGASTTLPSASDSEAEAAWDKALGLR
jgi:hypothetical protein